ncbi:hypothetical protein DY000_02024444 [Brassica cretica]|uniref:No apical meristem-associated C-terminal domain-containing protein n=1 Tax=Brassica cretica TaxID=69181 RepID=A0ABQ7EM60_BRACR|nr:hypothetical protein DY000_02024444 [Brassica cretica]
MRFLADFIKKVDDENNQKSPRSTMISHFAALKKKMKARISTKNNRAKKAAEKRALADRELEEMERNASVEHLRYVLVTTDQEIKQNLEILKIKAEDNNEAYKKNQSLRAAEAKLVKKAQKKYTPVSTSAMNSKALTLRGPSMVTTDKGAHCEGSKSD